MYYTLYTSNEFYEDTHISDPDNICLICWNSSNCNNVVTNMKDFTDIYSSCKCNPYFHKDCLITWVNITPICPICKKYIFVNQNNNNNYNHIFMEQFAFLIIFFNFLFRIICRICLLLLATNIIIIIVNIF